MSYIELKHGALLALQGQYQSLLLTFMDKESNTHTWLSKVRMSPGPGHKAWVIPACAVGLSSGMAINMNTRRPILG